MQKTLMILILLLGLSEKNAFSQGQSITNVNESNKASNRVVCSKANFPASLSNYNTFPWEIMSSDKKLKINYESALKQNLEAHDVKWIIKDLNSKEAIYFIHENEGGLVGFSGCKPHECDITRLIAIFSPKTKKVIIQYISNTHTEIFGDLPTQLIVECYGKDFTK